MEFTNPNQFANKIKDEGYELSDLWTDEEFDSLETEIAKNQPNISFDLAEGEKSLEENMLIERISSFCLHLTDEYRHDFINVLEEYRRDRRPISESILKRMEEKDHLLPRFTVLNGVKASERLQKLGYPHPPFDPKTALVIFQLPKIIDRFWYRGLDEHGYTVDEEGHSRLQNVGENVPIEWGHFYQQLMPTVWDTMNDYSWNGILDLQRINECGVHDPKRYYYLWEATLPTT